MDPLTLIGSQQRLEILRHLSTRDMYVSELMQEIGMDGTTATHHLDVLSDAGVIESYSEGRRKYYTLVKELTVEISPSPQRRFIVQFSDITDE
ncbi:MAG: ArsR/SmtB family transcription factor [Halobacteriaceae archaeon]